ncbi:tripartite tricarboxylate transporter substrate binding protein [Puniceibacterium sp. IMCC21224]|uniref:Bug family tripartite tricarboxylate transporter substrate binding protein n=1 Tax=Puniceibacterium sp. IMCC21224 TaxID=1618204 RepID=UPI00065D9A45|nr:tripartite tricarboxylate transporter substrate binding protein [Puniceibacterium sp. IMCC21224]KMK65144.1 hypothetical protein IMCC21224_12389 [Puniceibacterium sp. IMCC21224]
MITTTRRAFSRGGMLIAAAAIASTLGVGSAAAQDYPNKPVDIVLGFGTGGVSDIIARTLAPELEAALGQRFVVKNVPGAGGTVASQTVTEAGNDGYTLLNVGASGPIKKTLLPNQPFDQVDDFEPVAPVANFGLVVVVAPDGQFASLDDLLTFGRANPGALNVGTVQVGSTQFLAAKLFLSVAGIDAVVVPYSSTPELMGGVARGEVEVAFEIIPGAKAAVDNAQVRPVATTMNTRSALFPDLPTVEESGVAPYDVSSWNGYSAPIGVPDEVKETLSSAVQTILQKPEIKEKLAAVGAEPYVGTAADMVKRQEQETEMWEKVIVEAGVPIEG